MRSLALLFVLLLPVASAGGFTCVFDVEGEVPVAAGGTTLYLWNAECDLPCVSLWIYRETNGVDGLQVEDWYVDERGCYPRGTQPDTIIF